MTWYEETAVRVLEKLLVGARHDTVAVVCPTDDTVIFVGAAGGSEIKIHNKIHAIPGVLRILAIARHSIRG